MDEDIVIQVGLLSNQVSGIPSNFDLTLRLTLRRIFDRMLGVTSFTRGGCHLAKGSVSGTVKEVGIGR